MRWTWALAITAAAAGAALAQPAPAPSSPPVAPTKSDSAKSDSAKSDSAKSDPTKAGPPPGGYTQLFMSPCGEPWRAGRDDPYPMALWFKATDTNHDGAIDRAEFRADHLGFFDALDHDGDGVLTGAEIRYYEQHVAPDIMLGRPFGALDGARPGGRLWGGEVIRAQLGNVGNRQVYTPGGASGPPPDLGASRAPKRPLGGGDFGFFNDAEPLTAADGNLDGRVTRQEFQDVADRRFKRLDRKGDGRLTLDELPRTQADLQGVGRAKG